VAANDPVQQIVPVAIIHPHPTTGPIRFQVRIDRSLPGFARAETLKTQGPHRAGRFFKFPLVANLYSTPNYIGHKSAFRRVQSKLKLMPADDTQLPVKMREKKIATPSSVSSNFAIAHAPIPFQATSILFHVR
jgi:hypothetical protein